jgi:hypothetical protein
LIAGAKSKQKYDWDHTADTLAMMANTHWSGKFSRHDFHPMRERPPLSDYQLDDPAREYERLKREEAKR